MTDRIFKALGATDEHEALRLIEESSQFLAAVRELSGGDTFAESLPAIRNVFSLAREIEKVTEKPQNEAIGVVLAWKASADAYPGAVARVQELEEAGRKRDVQALIKAGLAKVDESGDNPHAGKLTPATAKFWETRSAEELSAFLAVAPRVIPGTAKQATPASARAFSKNEEGRATDADGRLYENISPKDRADLKKADPELYNVLREDWIKAGKPAGSLGKGNSASASN